MSSLPDWLGYILVGELAIFLLQKFPLPEFLEKRKFFKSLHECSLCLGVWVYTFLSWIMRLDLIEASGLLKVNLPFLFILTGGLTGGIVSYLVYIFILGWKSAHEVIIV
jgi:hypothetical protein